MPTRPAWDDLGAFLQPDEFATVATVTPQGGVSRSVTGIFDEAFLDTAIGEYDLDTTRPRFTGREADLAGLGRGDVAVIDGATFVVLTSPQTDGTGMAVLELARQASGDAAF
ncbi:head-tail joining protein [Limimaricola cinnabarinus]|uniref:head-tail joining protein n=1 Tax=Limimaricola cinnabarinus TaxID=1125964 RepID=UPI002FE07D53